MKNILPALSIVGMLAVFAGCGGASDSNSSPSDVSNADTQLKLNAQSRSAAVAQTAPVEGGSATLSSNAEIIASVGSKVAGGGVAPPQVKALRWSDQSTWGNVSIPAGANVTIPAGKTILLDTIPAAINVLTIDGELLVDDSRNLTLTANAIIVKGKFLAGSDQNPFQNTFKILLMDATASNDPTRLGMGTRGIFNLGGVIQFISSPSKIAWTKLSNHAAAGEKTLSVVDNSGWQSGDQVVVAPTDYWGIQNTESLSVETTRVGQITLTAPLAKSRWGRLQHASATGMSLAADPTLLKPSSTVPTVLDQRAAVGNLSRKIVIEGADDAQWRQNGFGAQLMVMGANSSTRIEGVEFKRMGQAGEKGRYPIHFHSLSYDNTGKEIPISTFRQVKNSTVSESSNRCLVIHGTNSVTLENNICHDISGHAIFLEDAVEKKNKILGNLVLKVRVPSKPLLISDQRVGDNGPAAIWLTNPDNEVVGNHVADSQGYGIWLAFPTVAQGTHKHVPGNPDTTPLGIFSDNTSHSNLLNGLHLDQVPFDDAGDTMSHFYQPVRTNAAGTIVTARAKLLRIATWKNRQSGFWNRVSAADYENWVSADNIGTFFSGSVSDVNIRSGLVVGTSLNNTTTWRSIDSNYPPSGFATYNSRAEVSNNLVVNMPIEVGKSSGAFKTDDYYIHAVDRGLERNSNNFLVNSHPGFRSVPVVSRNSTLAGALWDKHGYWGTKGNYWVYDTPFFTSGANCSQVNPIGVNGASCQAEYYGVGGFVFDGSNRNMPVMPLEISRISDSGANIGTWSVGGSTPTAMLANMRHFAAMKGARYIINYPGFLPKDESVVQLGNSFRADDFVILGIPFSGVSNARAYATTVWDFRQEWIGTPRHITLSPATSLSEVTAGTGNLFWQDRTNNLVWVKTKSPTFELIPEDDINSLSYVYRPFNIRIVKQ